MGNAQAKRETAAAPARRKDGARLAVLLMAPFLAQADATIVNVATPSIGADLGASGAVPSRYAADISGVSTTTLQIGGAIGVAAFGTVYLGLEPRAGAVHISAASAYLATHSGTAVDGNAE